MANTSIYAAFERMWQHVITKVSEKADKVHAHNEYETKTNATNKYNELSAKIGESTGFDPDLIGGTVEITDGNPEKDATVLTVNPEAAEINVYTAEEVDGLIDANRICYTKGTKEITWLAESTGKSGAIDKTLINGTYKVTVDGITYTCEAVVIEEYNLSIMGNGTIVDFSELPPLDAPFVIIGFYGQGYSEIIFNDENTHTTSIKMVVDDVVKIDSKYIPEYAGRTMDYCGEVKIPEVNANGEIVEDGNHNYVYKTVTVDAYAESFNKFGNVAAAFCSHAEGMKTFANGIGAHSEGGFSCAYGLASHCEGQDGVALGQASHVEGYSNVALEWGSHAEGNGTVASGDYSHSEGYETRAIGKGSHAEGSYSKTSGQFSHAEGYNTLASSQYQHVQGKYNVEDTASTYAHIVGNGTSDSKRSNAHTVDWNGNGWFAGTVEGTALILKSSTSGSNKRFKITIDDDGVLSVTGLV